MKKKLLYFAPTIIVLILIFIVLFGIQLRLQSFVNAQYIDYLQTVERQTGINIQYRALRYYGFNNIELHDLAIAWEGNQLNIDRVSVRLALLQIRHGISLNLINTVDISKAHIVFLSGSEEGVQTDDVNQNGTPIDIQDLLSTVDDLSIVLRNSNFRIVRGNAHHTFDSINVAIAVTEGMYQCNGMGNLQSISGAPSILPSVFDNSDIESRIRLSGSYNSRARSAEAELLIQDTHISNIKLQPQRFLITYKNPTITIANMQGATSLQANADYNLRTQQLSLTLSADSMHYGDIIKDDAQSNIPFYIQNIYTFAITVDADLGQRTVAYTGYLALQSIDRSKAYLLDARLDASGTERMVHVSQLQLESESGTIDFQGSYRIDNNNINGALAINNFSYFGSKQIYGQFVLTDTQQGLTEIVADRVFIGNQEIATVRAEIHASQSNRLINIATVFDTQKTELAFLSIAYGNSADSAITATGRINTVNLSRLLAIAHNIAPAHIPLLPLGQSAPIFLNTRFSITRKDNSFSYTVPFLTMVTMEQEQERELLNLWSEGDENSLAINDIKIAVQSVTLQGLLEMNRTANDILDFKLTLQDGEKTSLFNARYRINKFIRFTGSYGFVGVVLIQNNRSIRYNFRLASLPINIMNSEFMLRSNVAGHFTTTTDWAIEQAAFALNESSQSFVNRQQTSDRFAASYQFNMHLFANQNQVTIDRFDFRDHVSSFIGAGALTINERDFTLALLTESLSTQEKIQIDARYVRDAPAQYSAVIRAVNISFEHVFLAGIGGTINCTVSVASLNDSRKVDVDFTTEGARLNNIPLQIAGAAQLTDEQFLIERIDVQYSGFVIDGGTFNLNLETNTFVSYIELLQTERKSIIQTDDTIIDSPFPNIHLALRTEGALQQTPSNTLQLDTASLTIDHLDHFREEMLQFFVVRDDALQRYTLVGGRNDSLQGVFTDNATFEISASDEFPISFESIGAIGDNGIDIQIFDIYLRVADVPRIPDLGFIRFSDGICSGSLRIIGSSNNPEIYGSLYVENTSLFVSYIPTEIGPVSSYIIFQEHEIRISRLFATVGEGHGAYFNASFLLDNGLLTNFDITISTPNEYTVPFKYDFDVVTIAGLVHGDVDLVGGQRGMLDITGKIVGESGTVVVRQTGQRRQQSSRISSALFINLEMLAGAKLELRWPSDDIPILRVFPEQGEQINLLISGGKVTLTGTIDFRRGEVFFFDRNFLVTEGSLKMNEFNGTIDPLINVRAELREFAQRGPVTIILIIEDDFLSQLSPRLESFPALSQVEITTVLGGNILEYTDADNVDLLRDTVAFAGDVLARLAVLNDFENSLKRVFQFFDILTVQTQILQNVIYNLFIFDTTVVNSQSVARYLNNSSIFLGKYLAEQLFFQIELGLRTDEQNQYYNGGLNELYLDSSVSFEMQSPLGVLRWNIIPDFGEQFQISSTLELTWSYSY